MEKVFSIDPSLCTGCRYCEMVCSFMKERKFSPMLSRVKIIKIEEEGIDIPMLCMHCEDAPCKVACPVRAISRNDVGAIVINPDICIGCRACIIVCPFGAIKFDTKRGTLLKCDLCDGDPMCAKYCPTKAINFVVADREDLIKRRIYVEKMVAPMIKGRKMVAVAEKWIERS